tara:strand:+ start:11323 stop:12135 length:813 start_codon:yes stop_codon:yes gene_type:complete
MVILSTYLVSSVSYASCQWSSTERYKNSLFILGMVSGLSGLLVHFNTLMSDIAQQNGLSLSLINIISLIGFQLALIAIVAAFNKSLRGFAGGIIFIAGLSALLSIWSINQWGQSNIEIKALSWQTKTHVLSSLFAYGLLCTGAIISLFALIQDKRLRARKITSLNALFAPLEMTELLLFNITKAGFVSLFVAIFSGIIFIDNIFSQHLAHKTILSLIALIMFGILIFGRNFYGWRGRSAIYFYLIAFFTLAISYFGTRFILENILGKSWS